VENCPYGVIQLAEVAPKASLLSRMTGRAPKDVLLARAIEGLTAGA